MKRAACLAAVLILTGLAAFAGGSPEPDSEGWIDYPRLDGFAAVDLRMDGHLSLIPGESWAVRIRGNDRDIDDTDIYVRGNTLVIRRESLVNLMESSRRLEIAVTIPVLKRIRLSSDGTIRTSAPFETGDLELVLSGGGNMDVEAVADSLECVSSGSGNLDFLGRADTLQLDISGSGRVTVEILANLISSELSGSGLTEIRGTTDLLELHSSGSGDFTGDRLTSNRAEVRLSGSGDADIVASDVLEASLSGSGSLFYAGNPENTKFRESGSGRVRRK